jgi:hypothetical protein
VFHLKWFSSHSVPLEVIPSFSFHVGRVAAGLVKRMSPLFEHLYLLIQPFKINDTQSPRLCLWTSCTFFLYLKKIKV